MMDCRTVEADADVGASSVGMYDQSIIGPSNATGFGLGCGC